jgi:catechol 2,3-dioxygenase-like lactoylglutathione lyase family enzyme
MSRSHVVKQCHSPTWTPDEEDEMKLNYVIKYVADMDKAVAFFRDRLGLELRFQSPGWTEFATGETTLALHASSDEHPPGSSSLGFGVDDIDEFYSSASENSVEFTTEPTETFGRRIARFRDSEGAECGVSGQ